MHKDRRREEDAVTALQYALRQMDDRKSARRLVRASTSSAFSTERA